MSILIKGMAMPVFEHDSWDIRNGKDGKWYMVDTNAETTDGEWHEIIPVPPHGRLIDADELRGWYDFHSYDVDDDDFLTEEEFDKLMVAAAVVRQNIDDAPTIIEADNTQNMRDESEEEG